MLKITIPQAAARPACTRTNENELSTNDSGDINSGRIDDKMANLSSFTKKISFGVDFLISEASLAFTQ